jgi:photosystem II stability/assembly factor-like uncharacterized protein
VSARRSPFAGAVRAAAPALLFLALSASPATAAADTVSDSSVPARLAAKSLLLDAAEREALWVAVGERGHILTSRDRGATWTQASVPTRALLTGVWMHDEKLGWAVGHDETILRTADGGATWQLVHSAPAAERPLLDVWFADASHGFAVGAYGAFLATADGGSTWQERHLSEDDFHLNAIAAAADGTLYIAGEAGHLYRSEDHGESWHPLTAPYEGSLFGVLPLGDGALLVFGLRGKLFRSQDRGATWTAIATATEATLMAGLDLGGGRVVLAGLAGALLHSDDGGRTFRTEALPDRKANVALLADPADAAGVVLLGEGGARRPETTP